MLKTLAWALGSMILFSGSAWSEPSAPSIDGTSWSVSVNPDGIAKEKGEKEFHDTLQFASGKLSTNAGPNAGSEPIPYTLSRSGEKSWSFTAEQPRGSQGKYVWSGTVQGDDIRGKLVWTKSDGSVLTYTFKGDKRK